MKQILLIVMIIFASQLSFAQVKTLKGTVIDGSGAPIPSANVQVQGESKGTTTDFDGSFAIQVNVGKTLVVSYLGYETKSVVVGDADSIRVILKSDATTALTEVVVTSLGIKKTRKSLTYAAQELKGEELTRSKDANLVNTIAGKIAGVNVVKSAGGTGGSTKVTIRGNSSVLNNQPLYVIDGIPMLNTSSSQPNDSFGSTQGGNRDGGDVASLINPEDYEGMTILKGASAAALYGSQGARGVIMLTSKKIKEGTSFVRASSNTTFESAAYLPKFQTDYIAKPGANESWGAQQKVKDHVKDFFRTGSTQISAINFGTASKNSSSYLSYANTTSNGIIPTNSLKKHNFGLKQTFRLLDDKLVINANVNYVAQEIANRPTSGLYFNPLTGVYLLPRGADFNNYKENFEVYDPVRNLMGQNWVGSRDIWQNPYWGLNRNKSEDTNHYFNGALGVNYKANKWLSIGSRFNYDKIDSKFEKFIYATTEGTLSHPNGRYILINNTSAQKYGDLIATINTKINDDLSFNANIGASITDRHLNDEQVMDSNPSGLKIANWFTLHNFNDTRGIFQNYGERRQTQSLFASATIGFRDYLYADVTARKDWSSSLVNAEQAPVYPSLGVTTLLSEIIDFPSYVSFAKIRASVAAVGNDIPNFVSSPVNLYTAADPDNTKPTFGPQAGTKLKAERQNSFEIGTEWRFLENRIGLELTYYNNTTKNQLLSIPAPATNPEGYQNYIFNSGVIKNSGIEAVLFAKIIKSDGFEWDANVNYSMNRNKVTDLPDNLGGVVVLTPAGVNNYRYALYNNQAFGVIEGVKMKRDDQGRVMLNADGTIQKTGLEKVGNANPDFMIGFQNSFKLGNYFLNFTIDGRFGGDVMSLTQAINDEFGVSKATGDARNAGGVAINAVYPNGSAYVGKYPADSYYTQTGGRAGATGEYVYDATNVSLRELSLGYTFKLSENKFLKAASLSVVGRNLLFFYKNAPFDPNISLSTGNGLQGVDVFGMPSTRSIGLNLNVTF
ncbi:SusC/RagA family TonB-linked outer membrane protein [Flavobacterium succinicans]|uniref:TonB-dependent receptor plug domain protein n=1 Tax=Flavobacterium succinicans TaxID=29536 RepID=A0A199XU45_9FLAO|nr:SusC/RagA family TonB-linked outer membrane protein [Flavobacterium succinicans]OAZ05165.1 TonB-dependent receptor plug domain protein [Flavobacterium succinicans]